MPGLGRGSRWAAAAALAGAVLAAVPAAADTVRRAPVDAEPRVVVATLDTGTNPFHPSWRRDERRHPSTYIPGFPRTAVAARLALRSTYAESVDASEGALRAFSGSSTRLAYVPGTSIVGAWATAGDEEPVFDRRPTARPPAHAHGAQASSQIAGRRLGLAPEAYLVVMDTEDNTSANPYITNAQALRWAADQSWIDIIHTNIQNPVPLAREQVPLLTGYADAVRYAVAKGKLVVSAAGNFYAETSETSPHAGPRGVLVAGANDNCGFSEYSNLNPHVVMDGLATVSAEPSGFGTTKFSGTSSSSPRVTGYVAELLLRVRRHYGYTGVATRSALLTIPPGKRRPTTGPMADGRLTAAELHEVVRRTADPASHDSQWDGGQGLCIPQPVTGSAAYPKLGYGEVSEHTIAAAEASLLGRRPIPLRPDEDRWYEASEQLRQHAWETLPGG